MRCRLCRGWAGWVRRTCAECTTLSAIVAAHSGASMGVVLDALLDSAVPPARLERFLSADPDGTGSMRDRLAAEMANDVLHALRHRGCQTAADVARVRARGGWVALDRRPD